MPPDTLAARLRAEAAAVGVALLDRHTAKLIDYLELIQAWRRRAGLTAVADLLQAARVHIADSLLALRGDIAPGASLLDVGSGAGLPGIPLLIVRPDLRVTLLEANGRKAGFLEMAARELILPLRVLAGRAELLAHDPSDREQFETVVARAVAPLATLFELTLPFARPGGRLILLKGPGAHRELKGAQRVLEDLGGGEEVLLETRLSGGEVRVIVVVQKTRTTPVEYPRRSGGAGRRPLP